MTPRRSDGAMHDTTFFAVTVKFISEGSAAGACYSVNECDHTRSHAKTETILTFCVTCQIRVRKHVYCWKTPVSVDEASSKSNSCSETAMFNSSFEATGRSRGLSAYKPSTKHRLPPNSASKQALF